MAGTVNISLTRDKHTKLKDMSDQLGVPQAAIVYLGMNIVEQMFLGLDKNTLIQILKQHSK